MKSQSPCENTDKSASLRRSQDARRNDIRRHSPPNENPVDAKRDAGFLPSRPKILTRSTELVAFRAACSRAIPGSSPYGKAKNTPRISPAPRTMLAIIKRWLSAHSSLFSDALRLFSRTRFVQ